MLFIVVRIRNKVSRGMPIVNLLTFRSVRTCRSSVLNVIFMITLSIVLKMVTTKVLTMTAWWTFFCYTLIVCSNLTLCACLKMSSVRAPMTFSRVTRMVRISSVNRKPSSRLTRLSTSDPNVDRLRIRMPGNGLIVAVTVVLIILVGIVGLPMMHIISLLLDALRCRVAGRLATQLARFLVGLHKVIMVRLIGFVKESIRIAALMFVLTRVVALELRVALLLVRLLSEFVAIARESVCRTVIGLMLAISALFALGVCTGVRWIIVILVILVALWTVLLIPLGKGRKLQLAIMKLVLTMLLMTLVMDPRASVVRISTIDTRYMLTANVLVAVVAC